MDIHDPSTKKQISKAFSTASVVLGILSVVTALATGCCMGIPGLIFGAGAVICRIISKPKRSE